MEGMFETRVASSKANVAGYSNAAKRAVGNNFQLRRHHGIPGRGQRDRLGWFP